jgi:hypothetical protein
MVGLQNVCTAQVLVGTKAKGKVLTRRNKAESNGQTKPKTKTTHNKHN